LNKRLPKVTRNWPANGRKQVGRRRQVLQVEV
jgi:hypothetical protein